MKYNLGKKVNWVVKSLIIFTIALIVENTDINTVTIVQNTNLNKKIDLTSLTLLEITKEDMHLNIEENSSNPTITAEVVEEDTPQEVENEQASKNNIEQNTTADLYTGNLTGYVYNCSGCTGKLACNSSLDLSNGNVNYFDNEYGNVRIVAASSNYECGTILQINENDSSFIAIVLDRGVSGTTLDLLTYSVEDAINNIGNKQITYEILRYGY